MTNLVTISAFLLAFLIGIGSAAPASNEARNKLVVLMIDGCRWDYFSRAPEDHEAFKLIKDEGVVTSYVEPIFPSESFPSWTTIVTGKQKCFILVFFTKKLAPKSRTLSRGAWHRGKQYVC
ncbi:MAG TPA: hypothetical protein EYQ86_08155 [Bacteroidetes bacterium]|nr:hypothetical protein [Bacteroidota bacterium]